MTTIKLANTRNGFAIALRKGTDRQGAQYFDIVRVDRSNRCVRIHVAYDLNKARELANREWIADQTGSY